MGFMDKVKKIFFEEEDEDYEPEEETRTVKIESPSKEKIKETTNDVIREAEKLEEEIDKEIKPQIKEIKPEIKKVEVKNIEKKPTRVEKESKIPDLIFDDNDFILQDEPKVIKEEKKEVPKVESTAYKGKINTKKEIEHYKQEDIEKIVKQKIDTPVKKEYSKKEEEKKVFKPSPVISPVYGILDKNYKKEEVKIPKEIKITSRPSKIDFDTVRNKAFGDLEQDLLGSDKEEKEEVKYERKKPIRKIYDMTVKEEKPSVDKVTLAEADEYYNDLGLAYNTDYKDSVKDLNDGKTPETEHKKEEKLEDNLFDLIESMYDKED